MFGKYINNINFLNENMYLFSKPFWCDMYVCSHKYILKNLSVQFSNFFYSDISAC